MIKKSTREVISEILHRLTRTRFRTACLCTALTIAVMGSLFGMALLIIWSLESHPWTAILIVILAIFAQSYNCVVQSDRDLNDNKE